MIELSGLLIGSAFMASDGDIGPKCGNVIDLLFSRGVRALVVLRTSRLLSHKSLCPRTFVLLLC